MKWPFVLRRTHDAEVSARDERVAALDLGFQALKYQHELVKHGHEQGVLEGRRAAFVEVRASLADDLFMNPRLRYLAELGSAEDDQLAKMKGYEKARSVFQDVEPVQMFPTPAPQRAVEVPIEGLPDICQVLPDPTTIHPIAPIFGTPKEEDK
jgi:hypothetical protein